MPHLQALEYVVFSDGFAEDFGSHGDKTHRREFDSNKTSSKQSFWEWVHLSFVDMDSNFGCLQF